MINKPSHLPRRLTISFPIWGLHDTPPGGAYHNLEKMVIDHIERGFNCIRLDDGAGWIHDLSGKLLPSAQLEMPFGMYGSNIRQIQCSGNGGCCNLLARLLELAEACKRHGVFLILSSWFFLHTYWYAAEETSNDALFSIKPHERHMAFAKLLDHIIMELKKRKLADRIAFAEIFNEADDFGSLNNGWPNDNPYAKEEKERFRHEHTEALIWLKKRHEDILFAYDTCVPHTDPDVMPEANSMQVWNFHNYFLWNIYSDFEQSPETQDFLLPVSRRSTEDDVRRQRGSRRPVCDGWIRRVWFYSNLDPERIHEAETWLQGRFERDYETYWRKFLDSLAKVRTISSANCPDAALVCGEGVTYCGSTLLRWEEHSERYWQMLGSMVKEYREAGLWGTVVKTCCGPEDPCWNCRADDLLRLNSMFQGDLTC